MNAPYFHTIDATAKLLNCGRTMVYELINADQLTRVHIGRKSLITAESIDRLVRDLTANKMPPVGNDEHHTALNSDAGTMVDKVDSPTDQPFQITRGSKKLI